MKTPLYLPPTLRGNRDLFNQFLGAIKTRIEDRQKAMWSRIIGAGFTAEDIAEIHPETNMRFFQMKYAWQWQSFQIRDLNLRELDEIAKWVTNLLENGDLDAKDHISQTIAEKVEK